MTESLLYYIWQHRLFNAEGLQTVEGEPVVVEQVGQRNVNSGPDFTQARLRIGDTKWAGNVELHVKASDWYKHRHQHDGNYSNLILHVVLENDLNQAQLPQAPTLVLDGRIPGLLLNRYQHLMAEKTWIPCAKLLSSVDSFVFNSQLERLLIERLENKTGDTLKRLEMNHNNWEETMYQLMARAFGLKVNTDNFDLLARALPLQVLGKHKNSLFQLEALLFGQAGMLEGDFMEDYPISLKKEFQFLRKKHNLQPMEGRLWKFMRMRPAGFPTIRLAQFAMLLHRSKHLFSQILESDSANAMKGLLMVNTSSYWVTHYRFDHPTTKREKQIGEAAIELLIINTIAPLLFVYANKMGQPHLKDKALALLEQLPAEKNHITQGWAALGKKARTAYDSQALIQLKNEHCDRKDCLNCAAGNKILKTT